MNAEQWDLVKETLALALEQPIHLREDWLAQRSGHDPELYSIVSELLAQHVSDDDLVSPDPKRVAHFLKEHRASAVVGRNIGKFEILEVLGHGGMGVVYRAQQREPDRQVALKVIPAAQLVSAYQLRLFQREVQSLARMQHPNIATLFEAGTSDDGQHYFAMELVVGAALLDAVKERSPSLRSRLQTFLLICDAVHYAHQKGVIHRDLKPSNILVTAEGSPKLLDFGLAKLSEAEGLSITDGLGKIHGTLAYMSPEQARGEADIDVRSDVYSLGVVLYQLLTTKQPLDLSQNTVTQAIDRICKDTPPRAGTHHPALGGDLEIIIAKALEKNPKDRYQSADAMADEVRRYLSNQPIGARAPSALYHLRKFGARHRSLVAFSLFLFAVVIGFTLWMSVLRARSEREAARAEQALRFLINVFEASDPEYTRGEKVTAEEILDRGLARVEEFAGDPASKAELQQTIGGIYGKLGLDAKSLIAYEAALDYTGHDALTRQRLKLLKGECLERLGELQQAEDLAQQLISESTSGTPEAYRSHALLGRVLCARGRGADGEVHLEIALKQDADDTEAQSTILNDLGLCLLRQSRNEEAVLVFRKGLDLSKKNYIHASNLAEALKRSGKIDEARDLYRQSVEERRSKLGSDHPAVARALANYGIYLLDTQGNLDEAISLQTEALDIRRRRLGSHHQDVAHSLRSLASTHSRRGDYAVADKMYEEAVNIERKVLGDHSLEVANTLLWWGDSLSSIGQCERATPILEESLQLHWELLGEKNVETVRAMKGLARCVGPQRAAELQSRAFELGRELARENPVELADLIRTRGASLIDTDPNQAEAHLKEALKLQQENMGDHPTIASTQTFLAALYLKLDDPISAEAVLQQALSTRMRLLGPAHWLTGNTKSLLGEALFKLGYNIEAEPLLLEGRALLAEKLKESDQRTVDATRRLIEFYERLNCPDEVAKWQACIATNLSPN